MTEQTPQYFIGLISGTSMDGIDAALIQCSNGDLKLLETHSEAYSDALQKRLNTIVVNASGIALDELGQVDVMVANSFVDAARNLLKKTGLQASDIAAIGSHGQNIRHGADATTPFTLQIGDPNTIASQTDIKTVADFRRKDIALGGQGAPLAPGFHQAVFASSEYDRAVVNIGGISNMTLMQKDGSVSGHDCGPGNTLMDLWAQKHIQMPFDHSGAWAQMGQVEATLLLQLITDDYFKLAPPKSTGREYFNLDWMQDSLCNFPDLDPMDVQATLCDLTAQCIARDINSALQEKDLDIDAVYVCGGGAHNKFLLQRLESMIPCQVYSTQTLGVHPDWVEAMAFAWLAKQTVTQQAGNIPEVTGARRAAVLGGIYIP
ncbi:MAG: anhydro-N-acetylmuramic acid kinase [Gammaproteobacteria bacterium]|nr:anhydro-N-acetylmuramic acid kinase [Gammaproteobacteria bacterium]NNC97278.1 anhydro-N-acetylmuramic acid kinase [Gammaproteobacteria bacterium]NNM14596.1 anhydro-N-acetylmuramic acid kinase [Gammaproteobacteria bacterium]